MSVAVKCGRNIFTVLYFVRFCSAGGDLCPQSVQAGLPGPSTENCCDNWSHACDNSSTILHSPFLSPTQVKGQRKFGSTKNVFYGLLSIKAAAAAYPDQITAKMLNTGDFLYWYRLPLGRLAGNILEDAICRWIWRLWLEAQKFYQLQGRATHEQAVSNHWSRDVREWVATFPFPPIPINSFPFPIPFPSCLRFNSHSHPVTKLSSHSLPFPFPSD